MSDLISRQAAIDAINHICPVDTEYDCTLLDRVDVRCVLSDLPSAQPERKQGEWVLQSTDEDFLKIRPDNGDVSGLMDSIISTFNCRDE